MAGCGDNLGSLLVHFQVVFTLVSEWTCAPLTRLPSRIQSVFRCARKQKALPYGAKHEVAMRVVADDGKIYFCTLF